MRCARHLWPRIATWRTRGGPCMDLGPFFESVCPTSHLVCAARNKARIQQLHSVLTTPPPRVTEFGFPRPPASAPSTLTHYSPPLRATLLASRLTSCSPTPPPSPLLHLASQLRLDHSRARHARAHCALTRSSPPLHATLLTTRPTSCSPIPPSSTPFHLASQLRLDAPSTARSTAIPPRSLATRRHSTQHSL